MANNTSNQVLVKTYVNTVFHSGPGKQVYRIPALFYDENSKTLMAFAEKRKTPDDKDSVALVMSTGKVNFENRPPTVTWSAPKDVVKKENLKGHRPMGPCPVYEKSSNTLFLFFIGVKGTVSEPEQIHSGKNQTRLYYITIKDAGENLEEVKDVTDSLPEIKKWSTFGVGPGHGCQTKSGRLIVPAYAYPLRHYSLVRSFSFSKSSDNSKSGPPQALSIYSDDKGVTWETGEMLEPKSIECQMAEFSDGKHMFIYCNARSRGGPGDEKGSPYRVEAVRKGRKSFSKLIGKLVETDEGNSKGCQGSVVSFPAQPEGAGSSQEPQWLLYSHPTNKSSRVDLGVYLNTSPKWNAWSEPMVINSGPSGYSDLAYMGGGWFACLMERGKKNEQIACRIFSYTEVEEGIKK